MFRDYERTNFGYMCCGLLVIASCIGMVVYGTHNMFQSRYTGMSCGGDNITDINITNTDNCNIIDFTTCVYDHFICSRSYHIKYPLNNTCINNNTMTFIIDSIINKTEFTCYIDGHHGTIIDNSVVEASPSKFLIISWCMVVVVLFFFCIHCCVENNRRNIRKEYYVVT
jgi:hypothetical protein